MGTQTTEPASPNSSLASFVSSRIILESSSKGASPISNKRPEEQSRRQSSEPVSTTDEWLRPESAIDSSNPSAEAPWSSSSPPQRSPRRRRWNFPCAAPLLYRLCHRFGELLANKGGSTPGRTSSQVPRSSLSLSSPAGVVFFSLIQDVGGSSFSILGSSVERFPTVEVSL